MTRKEYFDNLIKKLDNADNKDEREKIILENLKIESISYKNQKKFLKEVEKKYGEEYKEVRNLILMAKIFK